MKLEILKKILIGLTFGNFLQLSGAVECDSKDSSDEARLKRNLFCNGYDSSLRPVKDYKTTTKIGVTMFVKSYDFTETDSTLTLNVWLRTTWMDEFLVWNPSDYGEIKSVDIGSDLIWKGDYSLYNADLSFGIGTCHLTNCLLESSGSLSCVEPCTFVGHCKADYVYWPFDQQNCSMTFGPWMNAANEIDYLNSSTFLSTRGSTQHTQWRLISSRAYKKTTIIKASNSSTETFIPTVNFSFTIERHSAMIMKVLSGNLMILITINLLTLLIKWEKKERLILIAVNVYMHFQVIHQMSWTIPANGDKNPNAMAFIIDSLIMTAILFMETIFLNWLSAIQREPMIWMTTLLQTIKNKNFDFLILHSTNGDEKILIEEEPTTAEEVLAAVSEDPKPKYNSIWQNIAAIVDLIVLALVAIFYALTCVMLIPETYLKNNFSIEGED